MSMFPTHAEAVLAEKPIHAVPGHTLPLIAEKQITEILTNYRNAVRHVFDATIAGINKGLTPDELAHQVKLPPELASNDYLREFYGNIEWGVRAIFSGTIGWFDGNPEKPRGVKRSCGGKRPCRRSRRSPRPVGWQTTGNLRHRRKRFCRGPSDAPDFQRLRGHNGQRRPGETVRDIRRQRDAGDDLTCVPAVWLPCDCRLENCLSTSTGVGVAGVIRDRRVVSPSERLEIRLMIVARHADTPASAAR